MCIRDSQQSMPGFGEPSGQQRRYAAGDGADRIPPAGIFHVSPGAGLQSRAITGSGVGQQCVRRGAHRGRAYSPVAQGAGAARSRCADSDRAW